MNFLALSAQWLKIASECGHAKAMLEYAKFLCSPGWAFYLTRQTEKTQTAKHTTQPQQQSRITPEQEALLQNAIDAPLALSLLHRSYSLEPNEDTAFYIAMIYLTAPPLASFSKTLSTFNSSYRMQPEGNQSPINWALVEPTTAHTLSVHRDVKLAATWFSRSLPNSSTDPLKTPIQISAAFNLAKLHLKQDSNESHKTAVNLLQRVVATNTQEPNHTEDMGIAAAYLLGHCLIRGVGLDANDAEDDDAKASRYEQGQAWLQICRIRTEEVGDKASKDDSINKSEAIETALSNAKCQTILTNCFRQLKILVEGVLLEGNGGEELGEGNISCSPLFMLAYGLCLRFGVGTGCQPDECKGVYWIERAKRILGFRIEPEWNILVGSGLNESKSLFMDLRSMFGGHSKKAAATVGREDDEMATGIIGLQVSPAVPNLKGSASGDFSSSFEVASLPPLPPNYTVRQKASKATVSKLSSIYPPVNQILSEKVLGENMVIVEKLVEREDFD
ncbi:hypothetical protein BDR26DRAFT_863510 [Obelidium mucronatum]|nr:hypothetical protein BDR26DRAFT_863510 [Obelidium mucronatum]